MEGSCGATPLQCGYQDLLQALDAVVRRNSQESLLEISLDQNQEDKRSFLQREAFNLDQICGRNIIIFRVL